MVAPNITIRNSVFLNGLKREIQAVLFDMDGVLADTIPLHIQAWNIVLRDNNLPDLSRDDYLFALGRTNLDMITRILDLQKQNLPLSQKREIVAAKEDCFRSMVKDQIALIPGVYQWLNFFRDKNIPCSVASSGEMANIVSVLETLRISDYFSSILSGVHLPESKPNPLIFQLAAASLGVLPEKCLVFEDAIAGIRAANSANMVSCAVATTLPESQLSEANMILGSFTSTDPEMVFTCP